MDTESVALRRMVVIVVVVPSIIRTVFGRLAWEMRLAWHLAWLDVRIEIDAAKRMWRSAR